MHVQAAQSAEATLCVCPRVLPCRKLTRACVSPRQSDAVKRKMVADERAELASKPHNATLGATSSEGMDNTHFIHDKQAEARMIMAQQDEDLTELGQVRSTRRHMCSWAQLCGQVEGVGSGPRGKDADDGPHALPYLPLFSPFLRAWTGLT